MASLRAYMPLATLSLPTLSVLHPDACNPAMDLVALLAHAPPSAKGADSKGHAVTLWRLNGGPRVWTKDVGGWVEGMGWSPDGLRLALYVRSATDVDKTTLEIHSVHDGERLQTVDAPRLAVQLAQAGKGKGKVGEWDGRVKVAWTWTAEGAPVPSGSALSLISSMPFLHPREVAPAPSTHAFFPLSLPGAAAQLKPSEPACLAPSLPRLAHSVLPPLPPEPPRASLLTLTLAAAAPDERPTTFAFLSGSFPLPPSPASAELSLPSLNPPTPETTAFAQTATALEELLRYVALGVDDLREAWVGKGGSGTATREWVASIGDALRQHGEDGDVRRALGALLLTGRPGEGLMNLLGGKLTPRTLSRWESTVLTSLTTIRQTCYADLIPATERVLLMLKELHGWSLWPERYASHLRLDVAQIEQAIDVTTVLAHELMALEAQVRDEHHRFSHFCLWLAYEIATAAANASQDSAEDDPLLDGKHNVLLVADFIQAGLADPAVDPFFRPDASVADVLALAHASSLAAEPGSNAAGAKQRLATLITELSDIIAHPPSSVRPHAPHGQEPSFSTSAHSMLKSPVLNRSRARLPSPAKLAAAAAADRSRRTDAFDAMDESSADMSMSMELDQSTASAAGGFSASDAGASINAAPDVMDEDTTGGSLAPPSPTAAVPAAPQPPGLPTVVDALVGVVRAIVEGALVADDEEPDALAARADAFGTLRRIRRIEGEPAQLALLTTDPHPALWVIKRTSPSEVLSASFALHLDPSVLGSEDSLPVDVLDLGFFTADELVLLLSVGPDDDAKILLASVGLGALAYGASAPPPSASPSAVDPWLAAHVGAHSAHTAPTLPLTRVRHLTSLDRLPRPAAPLSPTDPPAQALATLALNGAKGRMTGSVLAWAGRELAVFDLAEDEEDDEDGMED